MKISEEKLSKLLEDAQQAHHEYEKTLDGSDDEWAKWYAAYIRRQIEN